MGKFKALQPRLAPMASRFGRLAPADSAPGARQKNQPGAQLYGTARWQRLRKQIWLRDLFTCCRCGLVTGEKGALVCDHRIPHRGDEVLFWDEGNLQTMCKVCHDSEKQREDKAAMSPGVVSGGMAMPYWFRRVHVPLTIVCGPPASGKSTYVRERARPDDLVVCFETITAELFGPGRLQAAAGDPRIGDVLRRRNDMLGSLMRAEAKNRWRAAWLILTEPRADRRQWWVDRLAPAEVVVLETSMAVCVARAAEDAAAGDARSKAAVAAIGKWWADYTPRAGDTVLR